MNRRCLLSLLCALIVSINGFSAPPKSLERGYRGFLEIGPAISLKGNYVYSYCDYSEVSHLGYFTFNTTHGYQFNKNWFLGAGIGINVLDGIPLFLDGRYDFNIGKATPFVDFRIIYNFMDSGDSSGMGFAPTIGYRFNWGRKFSLNLGVGFTFRDMKVWKGHEEVWTGNLSPNLPEQDFYPDNTPYVVYDKEIRTLIPFFNFRIGIEF